MRVKRFFGRDSNAALQEVKLAFGEDAVILETCQCDDAVPERRVEIVAAIDYDPGLKVARKTQKPRKTQKLRKSRETGKTRESPKAPADTAPDWAPSPPAGGALNPPAPAPAPLENPPSAAADLARLQRELNSVKGMMGRLLVGSGLNESWSCSGFNELLNQLLLRKVSSEIAYDLLTRTQQELNDSAALKQGSEKFVAELLKAALAGVIMRQVRVLAGREMARVITLVGPTGVGKTTTLAKLAALFAKAGERVALISVDTYRLGAAAQTLEYARRLKMPVEIVRDRKALLAALNGFAGFDRVLLDTMGRSIRDHKGLAELCRVLKVVIGDTFLVLPAGIQEEDLLENLVHFRAFGGKALLFTKLDETACYGSILNGLYYAKLPLSFFTNGQKVPADIEIASAERLADLLLDII